MLYIALEDVATPVSNDDLARHIRNNRATGLRHVLLQSPHLDGDDSGQRQSLLENILAFSQSRATMPEDKVYALLGISSGSASVSLQREIQLNGLMAPRQLYAYIVQLALEVDSPQFGTFAISGASQQPLMTGLPSWAPDLTSITLFLNTTHYHRPGVYSAGSSLKAEYDFRPGGAQLRMRGVLLDHVHSCTMPICDFPGSDAAAGHPAPKTLWQAIVRVLDVTDAKSPWTFVRPLLDAVSLVRQHIPDTYLGGMDPSEALCRTILQGLDQEAQDLLVDQTRVASAMRALAELELASRAAEARNRTNNDHQHLQQSAGLRRDVLKITSEGSKAYDRGLAVALAFRQVAITRKGYLASVPWGTKQGDAVCIFQGAPAPCVLRPVEDGGPDCYLFHGEAYVQGWMHGEAMDLEKVWFTLT